MRYLILTQANVAYAKAVSARLYELMRAPADRDAADVTTHYCDWRTHPVTGQVAIALPEEEIPVSPRAPDTRLVDFIKAALTTQDIATIKAAIQTRRGTKADPIAFLPPGLKANQRTAAQMVAAGWFSAEEG